jgi:hypothetical protein
LANAQALMALSALTSAALKINGIITQNIIYGLHKSITSTLKSPLPSPNVKFQDWNSQFLQTVDFI